MEPLGCARRLACNAKEKAVPRVRRVRPASSLWWFSGLDLAGRSWLRETAEGIQIWNFGRRVMSGN
eukprot:10331193-Alexandrium_andersonii.AAC.1